MNAWGLEDERMASTATETLMKEARDEDIEARVLLAVGISPSICAILEADWEGNTGSKFSVKLRFGCSGTDGTPGDNCQGRNETMSNG
jgi:hypothetical protein